MDVHQATISVAVRDSTGKLVMECILETKAETSLADSGCGGVTPDGKRFLMIKDEKTILEQSKNSRIARPSRSRAPTQPVTRLQGCPCQFVRQTRDVLLLLVPDVAVCDLAGVLPRLVFAELTASLNQYCRMLNNDHVPFSEVVSNQQAHIAIFRFEPLNVPEHESS
jgi:hypothetical protein